MVINGSRTGYIVAGGLGFLMPLAMAPRYLSFNFDSLPKVVCLYLAVAALLLAPGVFRGSVDRLLVTTAKRLFLVIVLAESISLVVSTIFSVDPRLSLFGTQWRYFGVLSQLAVLAWGVVAAGCISANPEALLFVLRAFSLGGLVAAAYALSQFFGFDPLLDTGFYTLSAPGNVMRPPSSLGHAGYMAGYEVAVLFVALGLQRMETGSRWRVLHFTTAALAVVAIAISGTRAAALAIAVGFIVLYVFRGAHVVRGRSLAALLVLTSTVFGLIMLSPRGKDVQERLRQWVADPGGTRLPVWKDTFGLIGKRVIAGHGPETFVVVFPQFQSRALSQRFPDYQHESPHNIFLDTAVSQGFAGFLALIFGIGLAGRLAWTTRAAGRPIVQILFAGAAACSIFHQFFVFTLPNYCAFILLISALVAVAEPAEARDRHQSSGRGATCVALGAALGVILMASAVQLSVTDHWFAHIESLLMRGDLAGAVDAYRSAQRSKVAGYAPDLWYSRQMASAAQLLPPGDLQAVARSEALDSSLIAARNPGEDRLPAAYNRAVLCAIAGQLLDAESAARQLEAGAPNWYQPHWILSRVLLEQMRPEEARREAEEALALVGDSKPALRDQIAKYLRLLPFPRNIETARPR